MFTQGDEGNSVYFINNGQVKVYTNDEEGNQNTIRYQGPGEYFGELALIDEQPRSATVETTADSDFTIVSKLDFKECLSEYPSLATKLIPELTSRIRDLQECLRSRDAFRDFQVPKMHSIFDSPLLPGPPCVRALRHTLVSLGAGYAALPQWLDAAFACSLCFPSGAMRTTGKQSRLAATRDYPPSLRSPWRAATEELTHCKLFKAYRRLRPKLYRLAAKKNNGTLLIEQRFTQEELGQLIGTSRETITNILNQLKIGGWIEVNCKKQIVIKKTLPRDF